MLHTVLMKMETFPDANEIRARERMGVFERFETENKELVSEFKSTQIKMNPEDFGGVYRDFGRDQKLADELERKYANDREQGDVLGDITEVLAYRSITKQSALGSTIKARKLSSYDDYIGGEDLGIYVANSNTPMVSGIDITSNQNLEGDLFDGLHKKMERVKKHIDFIAGLDAQEANDFKVWFNSGGYSDNPLPDTKRQSEMEKLFSKVAVLKYYKTAEDEESPNMATAVFAAPQLVLAYDQEFVNSIAIGNERARREYPKYFDRITTFEAFAYIVTLSEYLKKMGGRNNYIYESYQIGVDTWLARFSSEEFSVLFNEAKSTLNDSEAPEVVKQQMRYFLKAAKEVFKHKEHKPEEKVEVDNVATPKPVHTPTRPVLGIKKKE